MVVLLYRDHEGLGLPELLHFLKFEQPDPSSGKDGHTTQTSVWITRVLIYPYARSVYQFSIRVAQTVMLSMQVCDG